MAKAYVIGHITIKDDAKWLEYRDEVPATIVPWGGELVFRGQLASVLSGSHKHHDTVVIRFPDMTALNSWHSSPEYQALIALRQQAADVDLIAYEE